MPIVAFSKIEDAFERRSADWLNRQNSMQAFFNSTIFKMYQKFQQSRWITENDSEGSRWEPLTTAYATYKKKKFVSYEGSGSKLMIATGTLVKAAIGEGSGYYKIATNEGIKIGINDSEIPYAKYAATDRPIMKFGKESKDKFRDAIKKYIRSANL